MSSNEEKHSIAFEGLVTLEEATEYLKSLQAALKKGTVYVQHGADVMVLEPEQHVTMAVEARSKKDKHSLTFEIKWVKLDVPADGATKAFAISAKDPDTE